MKGSIVLPGNQTVVDCSLFCVTDVDEMQFTIEAFDTIHQTTVLLSEDLKMGRDFIKLLIFDFSVIYFDTFSVV